MNTPTLKPFVIHNHSPAIKKITDWRKYVGKTNNLPGTESVALDHDKILYGA